MVDSERVGEQPHSPAVGLQPDEWALGLNSTERLALDQLHHEGFVDEERVDADCASARMAELMRDQDMVERLRENGFAGPEYDSFKAGLGGYGFAVIRAWIRRRQIYQFTAERGRPVKCPDHVRQHLARNMDARQELAGEVTAKALKLFHGHALIRNNWRPEGGASLTTYFVTANILVFPTIFRAWFKEYRAEWQAPLVEVDATDSRFASDPADIVCSRERVEEVLRAAPSDRVRTAIDALVYHDKSYAEIACLLDTTEDAVKQLVHRMRCRVRRETGGRNR